MRWPADELTTLQRGDDVTWLILPNEDDTDGEAFIFPAVVGHTELVKHSGLPWATWVEEAGHHGLVMGDEDSLMGVDTTDGIFTLALYVATSTGWCEHITLVAG